MKSKLTPILALPLVLVLWTVGKVESKSIGDRAVFSRTEQLSENYTVTWTVDTRVETVQFKVTARTSGYVGFGISDAATMTFADLVIGGIYPNKTSYFSDRYSIRHDEPIVDLSQDWTLLYASESSGITELVFDRKFDTGDFSEDILISDRWTNFIWSIGSSDSLAHHSERGVFPVNILSENGDEGATTSGPIVETTPDENSGTFTRTENFNENYTASWTVNKRTESIQFTINVRTTGYIGFGISDSGSMTNADIIIGGVFENKTVYFADRFAAGHGLPPVDGQQNWFLLAASEAFGVTTLIVERSFDTNDEKDVSITYRNTNFIWSIGSSDDLTRHATRGVFPLNILDENYNVPTEEPVTPPTTTTRRPIPPGSEVFTRTAEFSADYTATWTVNQTSEVLKVTVSVKTAGYIGFGISDRGSMNGADLVIVGVFANGTNYLTDRHSTGSELPSLDTQQDWTLIAGSEAFGITTVIFSRPFVTSDPFGEDVSIEYKDTYFIWSIGQSDNIEYHQARGNFPLNILQDPNASTKISGMF